LRQSPIRGARPARATLRAVLAIAMNTTNAPGRGREPSWGLDLEAVDVIGGVSVFDDFDVLGSAWTAKDPIGFGGGMTNLYEYVGGDPVNFIDFIGLMQLPADPSGLGPDWVLDAGHRAPNGQRYVHPSGDTLDYHPGHKGKESGRNASSGNPHWHHNGGKYHHGPGTEVPDPPECSSEREQSFEDPVDFGDGPSLGGGELDHGPGGFPFVPILLPIGNLSGILGILGLGVVGADAEVVGAAAWAY
jgi:hypothetical protein